MLNADLTSLKIEGAKTKGLEGLINCLRDLQATYDFGLQKATEFTITHNGTIEELEDGITRLTLDDFQVDCFQPYSDIDRFYFEY